MSAIANNRYYGGDRVHGSRYLGIGKFVGSTPPESFQPMSWFPFAFHVAVDRGVVMAVLLGAYLVKRFDLLKSVVVAGVESERNCLQITSESLSLRLL